MRVLLLTHYYEPEIGAPQRRWKEIVGGLTARGHAVAVMAPVPHYPRSRMRDLDVDDVPVWQWYTGGHGERILRVPYLPSSPSMLRQLCDQSLSSAAQVAAAAWMRRCRPDVVISTMPGLSSPFAGDAAAGLLGVPHIVEVRDAWPDLIADSELVARNTRGFVPKPVASAVESTLLPRLFEKAYARADSVVTTTEGFAERLRCRGISRVVCIRNSARTDRGAVRATASESRNILRLIYVGTVGRSQGLETVVKAVRRTPGVHLRIIGEGAGLADLHTAAGEDPRIEFFPQTVGAALEPHWSWADSGVVSLDDVGAFSVTVPSKLYTTIARGIHVLGVLDGEAADLVRESRAGVVSVPGEIGSLSEHLALLRDDRTRLDVGDAPRMWLEQNASPTMMVDAYESLIQQVVR